MRQNDHIKPVVPRLFADSSNREEYEPKVNRFCVAPTIQQCLLAVCTVLCTHHYIYRTVNRVKPIAPFIPEEDKDKKFSLPFDCSITNEGWIVRKTKFKCIGSIYLTKNIHFNQEAACYGCLDYSKIQYNLIWKEKNIKLYPISKRGVGTPISLMDFKYK